MQHTFQETRYSNAVCICSMLLQTHPVQVELGSDDDDEPITDQVPGSVVPGGHNMSGVPGVTSSRAASLPVMSCGQDETVERSCTGEFIITSHFYHIVTTQVYTVCPKQLIHTVCPKKSYSCYLVIKATTVTFLGHQF